jgi:NADP-dependent 3-hydroxy acid dehydrogenase YdfG
VPTLALEMPLPTFSSKKSVLIFPSYTYISSLTSIQGYKVIAADLNIEGPIKELNCEAVKLDIASPDNIQAFKQQVGDQPIDLLLNVAGTSISAAPGYNEALADCAKC